MQALAAAQLQDNELRSTFRGLAHNSIRMFPELNLLTFFSSRNIPSPVNWRPSNRGGYSNADFQRLYDAYSVQVDKDKGVDILVDALKVLSQDVAALPMFEYLIAYSQHADLKTPLQRASYAGHLAPWEWEWIR